MRAEENHPAFGGQQAEQAAKQQSCGHVEARERLVEHQQIRVVKESGRQTNTTGQLRRVDVDGTITLLAKLEPPAAR